MYASYLLKCVPPSIFICIFSLVELKHFVSVCVKLLVITTLLFFRHGISDMMY